MAHVNLRTNSVLRYRVYHSYDDYEDNFVYPISMYHLPEIQLINLLTTTTFVSIYPSKVVGNHVTRL